MPGVLGALPANVVDVGADHRGARDHARDTEHTGTERESSKTWHLHRRDVQGFAK
jgi:hypothetical protein